ncbi:MAG: CDP-alcohol phosphatidyltransferase family protein [Candidatus Thiodiazotropha sp. (ex Monitilora ramsayi)]|nr:CDP-alcohol phosphatidyltransferase family protein [Candidatus Thiodiazotropha sp. (ex Monitilora ramsayi)]
MIRGLRRFSTVPNLLSLLRILLAPLMLWSAIEGQKTLFLTLLTIAWLSDWLDGLLARMTDQVSSFGSKLDSLGDLVIYMTLPVGIYLLWPEVIEDEAYTILAALFAYLTAHAAALIKFRQLAGYHMWSAKFTAALMAVGLLLMLGMGIHWPFRLAVACLLLSACESILITLKLDAFRNDIPTVFHLKRENRAQSHMTDD